MICRTSVILDMCYSNNTLYSGGRQKQGSKEILGFNLPTKIMDKYVNINANIFNNMFFFNNSLSVKTRDKI